ncbi:MAG: hypothetical protein M0Z90_03650 [Desulfobacteraceae bacterium]|nr:hypothetical protein [Desulfobacteraceae bacterium]
MPPWRSWLDHWLVPPPTSPRSTRAQVTPRSVSSRARAAPWMPAPTIAISVSRAAGRSQRPSGGAGQAGSDMGTSPPV